MSDFKIPEELNSDQFFFLGIHPWSISTDYQKDISRLKKTLTEFQSHPQLLGLGEMGLDKIKGPDLKIQKLVFEEQLKIAEELKIDCIVLHNVKTYDLSLEMIKANSFQGTIILHDFYAHPSIYEQFSKHCDQVYISLGKRGLSSNHISTYDKKLILLETDDSEYPIEDIYLFAVKNLGITLHEIYDLQDKRWKEIVMKKPNL